MSLMKKLASVLVTASLVFGLVATAFAAPAPDKVAEGANRLHALGIVNGSDAAHPDDLQLDQQITRAQLMKIMVWAFGQKETASYLKGSPAFPDTATHWASGEIQLAKNIIVEKNHETMGMPDGTFQPEGKVTNAQAVAFLMKFIGVKPDTSKTWPANYLDAAVASGMLSASDIESITGIANNPATRGIVFYLADVAFSSYNMANGKTVYTTYVKPIAPVLNVETPVANTTDKSITINGSVGSDAVSLTVNGTAVKPAADGKFTADVELKIGSNTITVVATDLVKGSTTKTFTVARTVGAAAKIDVSPATVSVAAGASVDFKATITDKDGNVLDSTTADITSDAGTYADGKFTANTTVGTGTITVSYGDLTAVSVPVTIAAGQLDKIVISPATIDLKSGSSQKFTATGADAYGNEVAISGVTWTASKGMIVDGTFGALNDVTGAVTITATANGKSQTATVNVFGDPAKVSIAAPSSLVANGVSETTLTATVLDANGLVARNFNGNVTFASSNGNAATVKTATVAAVNGVATTTLVAGKTSGATVLSASAQGVYGTTVSFTPAKQSVSSFSLSADVTSMQAAAGSAANLKVTALDQTGNPMFFANLPSGVTYKVKLTSSDKGIIYFAGNVADYEATIVDDGASTHYAIATAAVSASATVGGVTVSGVVTLPTSSSLTVNSIALNTQTVGSPYQIKVDDVTGVKANETVKVSFKIMDFSGNQLTALADQTLTDFTVNVYSSASSTTPVSSLSGNPATVHAGKGTYSFTTTAADTYTVKVTGTAKVISGVSGGNPVYTNYTLVQGQNTAIVSPNKAYRLTLAATPNVLQANGTAQGTLKVTVADQWTNPVTDGSYAVKISKTTDNHATAAFADTTVNTVNGEATVTITATSLENAAGDVYTASATGLNGTTVTVVTQIFGAPYQVDFVASDASSTPAGSAFSGKAASTTKVYVGVKDATPGTARLVTSDNGRTVTVTVKDGSDVLGTYSGTTVNGIATVVVNNPTTSGTYDIVATADGLAKDTYTAGLSISAAAIASISVTADRTDLVADGSKATLTVKLLDANGNAKSVTANTDVYLKITSSTNFGRFGIAGATTDPAEASGSWQGWVKVTVPAGSSYVKTSDSVVGGVLPTLNSYIANNSGIGGSDTITARFADTTAGVVDGTLTINTVNTYNVVYKVAIDSISSATVASAISPTGTFHTVKVRVQNANGVLLTGKSNNVKLKIDSGLHGTAKVYNVTTAGATPLTADGSGFFTVAAVKGIATFYVVDDKADTLTYKAIARDDANANDVGELVAASGSFSAGDSNGVTITSEPTVINGNGEQVATLTININDLGGNLNTAASGDVTISTTVGQGASDYITLQQTSATVVNGQASIVVQAKSLPAGIADKDIYLTVAYDINGDGTIQDAEKIPVHGFLTVDSTNPTANTPSITTATAGNYVTTSAFTVRATASDSNGLYSVLAQYRTTPNGVWFDLGTPTLTAGNYDFAATGFADGTYEVRYVVTDNAKRVTTSTAYAFTVDTTVPTAVVTKVDATHFTVVFTDANAMNLTAAQATATYTATGTGLSVSSVSYDTATKTATVTVNQALATGDVIGVTTAAVDAAGNACAATTITLP